MCGTNGNRLPIRTGNGNQLPVHQHLAKSERKRHHSKFHNNEFEDNIFILV